MVIYALGMLAVFCFSAAYNLNRGPRRWLLQRFDHAAIYVKIAATYTPFAAVKLGGLAGFSLLGAVWAIAVLGAAAKLYMPAQFVRTSYVLYLAQGWACVFALPPLMRGAVGHGAGAAADRRRALHGGRRLPPVAAPALPQRHLARLRAGRLGLPLRRRARRRRAKLA